MPEQNTIAVWDPLIRLFHWSLVAAFLVAYLTEDDLMTLHVWAGYTVLGLIGFRLLWGIVGTRHARFTDFVRSPSVVLAYLRDIAAQRAKRHLGHNPAGGAMVIVLLVTLLLIGLTGLGVYAVEEHAGPLAGMLGGLVHDAEEFLEEAHEWLANLAVVLIVLHVAGVVLAGRQHGENLVRAMINGRKRAAERR